MANKKIKKLDNFYLEFKESNQFKEISEYFKPFNILKIIKREQNEHTHSNFLSYFLNPKESHGLKDLVLKAFIEQLVQKNVITNKKINSLNDFTNFRIYTESVHNIDLFLVSDVDNIALVIENKVNSTEHSNQLEKYAKYVEKHFVKDLNYEAEYLYLTLKGETPSEKSSENKKFTQLWKPISYDLILKVFQNNDVKKEVSKQKELLFVYDQYIKVLSTSLVENNELKLLITESYLKYKDEIDCIQNLKPNNNKIILDQIEVFLNKYNNIVTDLNINNSSMNFSTQHLESLFSEFVNNKTLKYSPKIKIDVHSNRIKIYFSFTYVETETAKIDMEKEPYNKLKKKMFELYGSLLKTPISVNTTSNFAFKKDVFISEDRNDFNINAFKRVLKIAFGNFFDIH